MTVTVNLLGPPSVHRDGAAVTAPRGRKAWALLGFLLASERPMARARIAETLFPDADDPLGALRWSLAEIRRTIPLDVSGDPVEVGLADDVRVDTRTVLSGQWSDAISFPGIGGEFLEGIEISSSPAFDAWLLNERRRFKAASSAVVREAVLAQLAEARAEEAIGWAVRLVAMDPLDETYQSLLVRAYVLAGDRPAALRQAAACRELLIKELGVEPGSALSETLHPSPVSGVSEGLRGISAARAQLEAGEAAVRAGAVAAGLDCLRRAALEAHSCGDVALKLDALAALGTALMHSGRNTHEEASIALHETIELAARVGSSTHEARGCYELGWREFLGAHYGRAEQWLTRALASAGDDKALRAAILWVRGKIGMEVGAYESGLASFDEAIALAEDVGDSGRLGFALASKALAYVHLGRSELAEEAARRSIRVLQEASVLTLLPVPEAFLAVALLQRGEQQEAAEKAEHAFSLAAEIGDVSMLSIAQRAAGLVAAHEGRTDEAIEHLRAAWRRLVDNPDHTGTMAFALNSLCEVAITSGHPDAGEWVDELESLAGRCGMSEMLIRAYLHRAALGDQEAIAVAVSLSGATDNPSVHQQIEQVAGALNPPASVGAWNSGASRGSLPTSSR